MIVTTTPQDWRVTAAEEARRAVTDLEFVLDDSPDADAPVPTLAEVLARVWQAAQAAEAAAGALVTAEVRAGMSWPEVARMLGFASADEARRVLAPAIAAGERRLHARLPHA
jgi:hypothetical protein